MFKLLVLFALLAFAFAAPKADPQIFTTGIGYGLGYTGLGYGYGYPYAGLYGYGIY